MASGGTVRSGPEDEQAFRLSAILARTLAAARLNLILTVTIDRGRTRSRRGRGDGPQRFSASSVVMLDPRKNNVADASAVVSQLPSDPASVQDQIQILMSRDLAGRVIDKLGLANDPEFNPSLSPGLMTTLFGGSAESAEVELRNAEIDNLQHHLSVDAAGLSTAITITYSARDPEKAARIANAIADVYISSEVDATLNATRTTTDWLNQRIRQLSHQVQAAEANVQAYKAEHNLNEAADGTSLVDQQMTAISTQLVQARSDLAEKQANDNRIGTLMKDGHANDVSQVVASPLIVQLREQQAEIIRQRVRARDTIRPEESQAHRVAEPVARSPGLKNRSGNRPYRRLRRQRCVGRACPCRLAAGEACARRGDGSDRPGTWRACG